MLVGGHQGGPGANVICMWAGALSGLTIRSASNAVVGAVLVVGLKNSNEMARAGQWRPRPNNDGTGTQWTGNWTTGRDANRPMAFKGLFGPPFAPRTQRNFMVRR